MVIRPVSETKILWLLDTSLVLWPSFSGAAKGLNPAKTANTSALVGFFAKNRCAVSRTNSISLSSAMGSRLWLFIKVSVVPTMILSCQGTANKTLPSLVFGTINA